MWMDDLRKGKLSKGESFKEKKLVDRLFLVLRKANNSSKLLNEKIKVLLIKSA